MPPIWPLCETTPENRQDASNTACAATVGAKIPSRSLANGRDAMVLSGFILLAALCCSLVAGLLFAFAVVIMPGLRTLDDAAYIHAFQAVDGVIQNNHPIFGLVWLGSVLSLVASAVLAALGPATDAAPWVMAAGLLYILGVQWPTLRIHIPLNNALQAVDTHRLSPAALLVARRDFEPVWNRWNRRRTVAAMGTVLLLLVALTLR